MKLAAVSAGIRYGLRGFYSSERKPLALSRQSVSDIHLRGGTILGTSRGGADMAEIVHRIKLWGLDMVFVIGGNGALHRARIVDRIPTFRFRSGLLFLSLIHI